MSRQLSLDLVYEVRSASKRGCLYLSTPAVGFDQIAVFHGRSKLTAPLELLPDLGSKPYDLTPTTFPPLVLLSPRAQEILRPFTGWDTFPVRAFDRSGSLLDGYQGLVVTGTCGPLKTPRPAPYEYSTLYFDPSTWDGKDIFSPKGTGCTLAVPEVAKAVKDAKLTNFRLRIASEV